MKAIVSILLLSGILPLFSKGKEKATLKQPSNIIRTCCAFGYDLSVARIPFMKKSDIVDGKEIGKHKYLGTPSESNGIVYTKRGGFIDLGHLRDYADWTRYLYVKLQSSDGDVELPLGNEAGAKTLYIDKARLDNGVDLLQLAGSVAYNLSLWHEIATWFGSSYLPLVPEAYSSFSPEDLYSNRLGIEIGIEALKKDIDFDSAVTQVLSEYMLKLELVPSVDETYWAMESVHNAWWTREKALPNRKILLKRYYGDGNMISPWLTELYPNVKPQELYKFDDELDNYYRLEIVLNSKIKTVDRERSQKKVISQKDFDEIVALIKKEDYMLREKVKDKLTVKQRRQEKRIKRHETALAF